MVPILLTGIHILFIAGIHTEEEQYKDQFCVVFNLVMAQLKQVGVVCCYSNRVEGHDTKLHIHVVVHVITMPSSGCGQSFVWVGPS